MSRLARDLLWFPISLECFVSRLFDRSLPRLCLLGALVAALALVGCGRKGPLSLPPGAAGVQDTKTAGVAASPVSGTPLEEPTATPIGGSAIDGNAGVTPQGDPLAPVGPKKRIPLDALLN